MLLYVNGIFLVLSVFLSLAVNGLLLSCLGISFMASRVLHVISVSSRRFVDSFVIYAGF